MPIKGGAQNPSRRRGSLKLNYRLSLSDNGAQHLRFGQPAGTIDQVVEGPEARLCEPQQTGRDSEAPKQPEVLFEIPFAEASVVIDNDPSAGSPTETLLRLLLPLSATVWSSFHQRGSVNRQASSPRTSLKRSIGSSDGRCVQRAGT
jgi:hypothetical protein